MLKMFSVLKNFLKSKYMKIQNGPKSCIDQNDSELQRIVTVSNLGKRFLKMYTVVFFSFMNYPNKTMPQPSKLFQNLPVHILSQLQLFSDWMLWKNSKEIPLEY